MAVAMDNERGIVKDNVIVRYLRLLELHVFVLFMNYISAQLSLHVNLLSHCASCFILKKLVYVRI